MAGCETKNREGNYDWSKDRVGVWSIIGAVGVGGLTYLYVADAFGLGALGGPASAVMALAIIVAAIAGAVLAGFVGQAFEWFNRLKEQDPKTITFVGWVACAKRNLGNPTLPEVADGDWTFNIAPTMPGVATATRDWAVEGPPGLSVHEVRTRTASGAEFAGRTTDPGIGPEFDILHTEIGSRIGDYAAVGGAVGSVAGTAVGIAAGVAACAVVTALTLGLGIALCALFIALGALIGALIGGMVGQLVGAGIGAIADALSDFNERGEAITHGCFVRLTGTWVTDRSHQHNEIHDITASQIIECGTAAATAPLETAGAVGIGRHPVGPDP